MKQRRRRAGGTDLPPPGRTNLKLVKSVNHQENALLLDPRQHCLTEHLLRVKMTWPDAYPKTTTSGRTNQRLL